MAQGTFHLLISAMLRKVIFPILQLKAQRGRVTGSVRSAPKPPNRSITGVGLPAPSLCYVHGIVILRTGKEVSEMPSLGG